MLPYAFSSVDVFSPCAVEVSLKCFFLSSPGDQGEDPYLAVEADWSCVLRHAPSARVITPIVDLRLLISVWGFTTEFCKFSYMTPTWVQCSYHVSFGAIVQLTMVGLAQDSRSNENCFVFYLQYTCPPPPYRADNKVTCLRTTTAKAKEDVPSVFLVWIKQGLSHNLGTRTGQSEVVFRSRPVIFI